MSILCRTAFQDGKNNIALHLQELNIFIYPFKNKHFTFLNLFLLHLFVYSILKIEREKKMLMGLAEDLCLISYLTVTAVANVRNS